LVSDGLVLAGETIAMPADWKIGWIAWPTDEFSVTDHTDDLLVAGELRGRVLARVRAGLIVLGHELQAPSLGWRCSRWPASRPDRPSCCMPAPIADSPPDSGAISADLGDLLAAAPAAGRRRFGIALTTACQGE
jgi:hypothetical protein